MMADSIPPSASNLTAAAGNVVTAHEAMISARAQRVAARRAAREARQLELQREVQIAEGVIAHNAQIQSASG